ncbi:PD-(D/E)XK nuclease family protein [Bacteroidales bacterium OttesenSCG-928-C19]|nr:PD-(D/E)XK nuclease family protein [Bacteroidales bacterium OttesenSCG-928-C19]
MNNSFLENIAKSILKNHQEHLDEVCVILPSRRAGLFLKRYLGELSEQPLFSPKILTINEFISENANLQIAEPIHLLFELYEIHKQVEKENAYTFNDFFSFGEMMIHDFSEVDLYLIDPKEIFGWLSDEKALSFWNLDGKPLTDFQRKYLRFYNSLYHYYIAFRDTLIYKKRCYEGFAFRHVAENIETLEEKIPYKKLYFCGFNALSHSEHKIFRYLERSGKASILWDSDTYYMDNEIQEAGKFLRKYKSEFKNFTESRDYFHESKSIHIIGAPENVLQTKIAGNLLEKINIQPDSLSSTALVLADEELLIPTLNSIPDNIEDINITMGYPFLQTPMHDLVSSIFQLHIQKEKSKNGKFYYQHVESILQNDLIRKLLDFVLGNDLRKSIEDFGKLYLTAIEIESICQSLFIDYNQIGFIFAPIEDSSDFLEKLNRLLEAFINSDIKHYLSEEYFLGLHEILKCFDGIDSALLKSTNTRTLFRIYQNFAKKIKIPFYGEPLKGLQLMGMLETRCVDFDRVILLSVNEGILPSGKTQNSLIPFNIKQHFGIPTYQDRDAIFAYHFYRLIQRAKEIYLVYNTDSDGFSKGEKSRFIKQLQYELPSYSKGTQIFEDFYIASFSTATNQQPITIKKDKEVFNLLKNYAQFSGFSPSALNTFCNCSLRFYFLYVLKIKEEKLLSEEITADVLGTAIHKTLETVFNKVKDSDQTPSVQTKIIEEFIPEIENTFIPVLKKNFKNDVDFGKNKLIVSVAISQMETFLKNQIELIKNHRLEILEQETKFEDQLFIKANNQNLFIKLLGFADRIDSLDGLIRIIDYKTGKVNATELKATEDTLSIENSKEKWLQLMMYAWLLNKKETYPLPFISGIYSLRKYDSELLSASFCRNEFIDEDTLNKFELFLKDILGEMFDTTKDFCQTEKKEHCRYCQFASLCGR